MQRMDLRLWNSIISQARKEGSTATRHLKSCGNASKGRVPSRRTLLQKVAGPDAAIPHFDQQLAIVEAAEARFESSLFEIRQLVQADLFDLDLAAADELAQHKFTRAAGALAGVVLEKHLSQVCEDHKIKLSKKKPTIADFNDALKTAGVSDIAVWRFVQHLADIRNKCDHARTPDPTTEEISDLLAGVKRIIKTLY